MKRFYSVIATAIVTLAAVAVSAQLNLSEISKNVDFSAKQKAVSTQMKAVKNVKSIEGVAPKAQAPANVTAADVEGDYTWTYVSYLSSNQGANTGSITVTAIDETTLEFVGFYSTFPVTATLASDGTITFQKQVMFHNTYYDEDIYFMLYQWGANYQGVNPSDDPIVGHYDNGTITFNEDDLIAVALVGQGYFMLGDTNVMTKAGNEEEEDPANWEVCGTADLMDGWILTCYGMDQAEYIIEDITVEKSLVEEGVYRLVNPYQNEMYADVNSTTATNGYIKFNIANPEFPFLYNGVKAGFANNNGEFYCFDLNGYYHLIKGYSASTILGAGIDGLSTFDEQTGILTIPTALFGITAAPNGGYSWQDDEGNSVDMTSSIKLNFWEAPEPPVEPTTDQIDFIARNYPTSNDSNAGDITETTTYDSDNGLFTATVTVSGKSTANRFWTASGGSQLRIYGGTVTIDGKGKEITQVKLSGAQLDNKGATRSPSYTINGLNKEEIIAAGGSISSTEAIWAGSSDKVVIEHTYSKENLQINSITVTFAPEEEPINITLGELVALEPGNGEPVEATVAVEGAKVTATYDAGDFPIAFVEDETGAVAMVDMSGEIADLAQGKALTGTIKGAWMDYGTGAMFGIEEFNCTAEDTEIIPTEIVESNELLEASNLNRLVTVTASPMCPITNEEGQVFVGDAAQVADVYYVLGWDYEFPENIASVTGVLVNMAGSLMIMPRSAEDIVAATPEVETTSYIVSWESGMDKANSVTTADGVKVQITGNESKQIQSGNAITLPDGTSYTGMKVSNGAQNTITLPEGMVATQVTFYSYVNLTSEEITSGVTSKGNDVRTSYWKEVDGVTYTEETASIMVCPNNKPVETPDVATFAIDKKNSFTYTNAGEQVVYVAIIEAVDVATGISNTVVYNNANGAIFNLAGQKVGENYKGIIIKNGKKILVK